MDYVSAKSGKTHDYFPVTKLPSNFRSYGGVDTVYVRGLFFEESLALSRYIGDRVEDEVSFLELVNIYSDVIRGIVATDLELIDLRVLIIISSMWTVNGFGWAINVPCPQEVEGGACKGRLVQQLTLDSFTFITPLVPTVPVQILLGGEAKDAYPLRLQDLIAKENYLGANPEVSELILDCAAVLRMPSFQEAVDYVRFGDKSFLKLAEVVSEFEISVEPLICECNSCHVASKVYIGFDQVKAFP